MTWIPVGERLPEVGVYVLVWGERDGVMRCTIAGITQFGRYWCNVDGELKVTHWQPLPEPPGKEAETIKTAINKTSWLNVHPCARCFNEDPHNSRFVILPTEEGAFYAACPICGDRLSEQIAFPWTI